ncbi:MAG TPA: hypothetical protein VF850_05745 [Gemmatimonadaceae bacterium]
MSTHLLDTTDYLRRMLWMVFGVSLAGCAFSATLSYRELAGRLVSCPPVGAPGTIFGVPACVFGLLIFAFLALVSGFALLRTSGGGEMRARPGDVAG